MFLASFFEGRSSASAVPRQNSAVASPFCHSAAKRRHATAAARVGSVIHGGKARNEQDALPKSDALCGR
jgi:hypothetical protein